MWIASARPLCSYCCDWLAIAPIWKGRQKSGWLPRRNAIGVLPTRTVTRRLSQSSAMPATNFSCPLSYCRFRHQRAGKPGSMAVVEEDEELSAVPAGVPIASAENKPYLVEKGDAAASTGHKAHSASWCQCMSRMPPEIVSATAKSAAKMPKEKLSSLIAA